MRAELKPFVGTRIQVRGRVSHLAYDWETQEHRLCIRDTCTESGEVIAKHVWIRTTLIPPTPDYRNKRVQFSAVVIKYHKNNKKWSRDKSYLGIPPIIVNYGFAEVADLRIVPDGGNHGHSR